MKKQILSIGQVLNRTEQKLVFGGLAEIGESGGCAVESGNGLSGRVGPNLTLSQVAAMAVQTGGHYCCASCCSVGWLDASDKAYIGC